MKSWIGLICAGAVSLLFGLLATQSCSQGGTPCSNNLECDSNEVCRSGFCRARSCLSSTECDIQHFCDDESGVCVSGCQLDRDCLPDEFCDEGACALAGCQDTNLDCSIGQFCNGITGTCFDAGGYYCQSCTGSGDNECGGPQNYCVTIGGAGPYCGVDCSQGQACPRGFDCLPISDGAGNIIARNCITPCWLLE